MPILATDELYVQRSGTKGRATVQEILDLVPSLLVTILRHVKPAGDDGSSFSSGDDAGSWGRLQPLNTQTGDNSFCVLNGVTSQFVIQPGTYIFDGVQVPYRLDRSRGALRDVSNGLNLIVGENTWNNRTINVNFRDVVEFTTVTTLEMRLKGQRSRTNTGFGIGSGDFFNSGEPNAFANLQITKIA